MKINIRGVRGSIPVTGQDTSQYGGNTTCASIQEDDSILVLDGGSGMQKFKLDDNANIKRIDILLSHLHLDHIQGLGFFAPFFNPSLDVHIWGPASTTSLHARLSRYLSPPLFPVLLRDLPCKLTLHDVENSTFAIGPFNIESRYVIHPGPTVGYRITGKHSTFTFIPDHEPALGKNGIPTDQKWLSGFDLAHNTDLLFHDSQYTAQEYPFRQGWGHSNMEDVLRFAEMTNVKRLLMTHHDPSHTDAQLDAYMVDLKSRLNYSFEYEFAAEGMEIELG
jgi:phosphoribosyl 1,2-cyclic phosphodiesterase